MKSFVVFALFVAAAVAVPVGPSYQDSKDATVVRYENDNIGVDGYKFGYETSDGKIGQEQGQLKNVGTENEAIEVRGQYSYPGPDGVVYSVTYVADENGFHPEGAHIPKA